MSKIPSLGVRVPPEVRAKLQAAADRDRRPLSQFIRILLTDAVEPRDREARAA